MLAKNPSKLTVLKAASNEVIADVITLVIPDMLTSIISAILNLLYKSLKNMSHHSEFIYNCKYNIYYKIFLIFIKWMICYEQHISHKKLRQE